VVAVVGMLKPESILIGIENGWLSCFPLVVVCVVLCCVVLCCVVLGGYGILFWNLEEKVISGGRVANKIRSDQ